MSTHLIGELFGKSLKRANTIEKDRPISYAIDYCIKNPGLRGIAVVDGYDHVTGFLQMRELANQTLTREFPRLVKDIEVDHVLPDARVEDIALAPVTVHFEDPIIDAIRKILVNVTSEVFVVDADGVLMGSLTIEDLFAKMKELGLLKKIYEHNERT